MLGFLNKIFDNNDKEVKRIEKDIVSAVAALEPKMKELPNLAEAYQNLRERYKQGEALEDLMPEAFAMTRESMIRNMGMRHYDVQMVGAAALHYGRIAEMKTGEGKTFVATLALALNAIPGKGTHLVTTNEYLAQTGAEWMGPIYRGLGLTVSYINHGMTGDQRRAAYLCDITYITNSELGFDYLRDNMALRPEQLVLRKDVPLHYAIIDEVDSILIDEARTPLIISGPAEAATDTYYTMAKLVGKLERGEPGEGEEPPTGDYTADEKTKDIHLTEQGIEKAEKALNIEDIFSHKNMEMGHMLRQALRAKEHYHLDKQYVKNDEGQIVIVDEFTGRLMPGRRFGEGLHQAIEAKEGVKIERENQTLATITYQNFFKLYDKIAGMTGTAKTEEKEFQEIYASDVLVIPTNKPVIRKDYDDVVYRTIQGKYDAVVAEIAEIHGTGQPILVGTVTIEASERLSSMLKRKGIKHEVLNAKYHLKEAEIVSQAGRIGAVTISTNMAGRGTDIVLGGNPEMLARQLLEREGLEKYDSETELFIKSIMMGKSDDARSLALKLNISTDLIGKIEQIRDQAKIDQEKVRSYGGLHIIGTERHESRRIDNQLRGRSGRQGDPGSSRFYVSFEDDLMRLFANERVLGMMDRLGMDDSQPIEAKMVTGAIERAQKRVEDRNFGIRKQLLEFDNVMSKQREVIYSQRRDILLGNDISEDVQDMIADYIDAQVQAAINPELEPEEQDIAGLRAAIVDAIPHLETFEYEALRGQEPEEATDKLVADMETAYKERENELGTQLMRELERFITLQVVDQHWKEQLHNMDVLRQGIGLRGYGQRNPIQEYAFEAFNLFEEMKQNIKLNVAKLLFRIQVQTDGAQQPLQRRERPAAAVNYTTDQAPISNAADQRGSRTAPITKSAEESIGRNDPCPCGSGKKYKHCHGRKAA
ncbi:MAG: preprotein translocase subunit SecA [Trueperaceae bacterium]|nr:preprotein translocase subunit SecA [Trueperaceae bacterium]